MTKSYAGVTIKQFLRNMKTNNYKGTLTVETLARIFGIKTHTAFDYLRANLKYKKATPYLTHFTNNKEILNSLPDRAKQRLPRIDIFESLNQKSK